MLAVLFDSDHCVVSLLGPVHPGEEVARGMLGVPFDSVHCVVSLLGPVHPGGSMSWVFKVGTAGASMGSGGLFSRDVTSGSTSVPRNGDLLVRTQFFALDG